MAKEANLVKIENLDAMQIASICDHTYLNRSEAYKVTAEKGENPVDLRAKAFGEFLYDMTTYGTRTPFALCVRPEDVKVTRQYLDCANLKDVVVASVVGFPDGSSYETSFKVAETKLATDAGAKEIDMVLNHDLFVQGHYEESKEDVRRVNDCALEHGALVKLILETSELDQDLIKQACELANQAGVAFVKTSTGFSSGGATAEDLAIMRQYFDGGVKMSGGVTPDNVYDLLRAVSGRDDGYIDLDPMKVRIGESSLLSKL